ncbi:hypothetical protein MUP56_01930, partial [Patescibacteria group bacterium]|nr:hypothetical protein [Patescibacteria group bacterium]
MKRMLCIMGICGIALFGVKPDRFTAIVREIRTRMVHPNSVHAAIGGPITIDAPVTFTKDVGITSASYKFIDSANPAYFIAPGNSDISLVVRGKVGIGTTTPATTLDVNGSAYIGTTTNRLYIKDDNDAIELIGFNGTSYNNISLRASGGPTLHLNTNGKVGIGTTTP